MNGLNPFASLAIAVTLASGTPARADLSISKDATHNVSCSGGVCTPTAKNAVLNVGDLTNMLLAHDLTVQTGSGDGTAASISIVDGFSWADNNRLTLSAKKSITVKAAVTVAGDGALTINYNQGNVGGDLLFDGKGKIDFWNLKSSLKINGNAYTLSGDVPTLIKDIKSDLSGFHALANDTDAANEGTIDYTAVSGTLTGVFEGLGHTISNVTLGQSDCEHGQRLGFFADVGSGAAVRDVAFANAKGTSCTGGHASLVVAANHGTIQDVSVSGSLQSTGEGGVFMIGGVAAANFGGIVTRSQSSVTVDSHNPGSSAAGSLVGWSDGSISLSHATGNVSGVNATLAGGLAGFAQSVDQSFATGSVTTGKGGRHSAAAGGLIGSGAATNSYATGAVQGEAGSRVGGLLGFGSDTTFSYATGAVGGANDSVRGGFVGADAEAGDLSHNYWDLDTSGIHDRHQGAGNIPDDPGIKGLSDTQLKSGLPNGFEPKVWGQDPKINGGYPYLRANPPQ
jgi:hypothetical protein